MPIRALLAASALLLCCAALVPSPASAQRRAADSPGFSISAVGHESFFVFEAKPGDALTGTVLLTPEAGRETDVVLKAVDVTTAATGGVEYRSEDPEGVGSWIDLSESRVRLEGSPVEVPFEAQVPKGARAGDHFAGIIAYDKQALGEQKETKGQVQLQFISRLAIATQFTLPGPKKADVRFDGASIEITPSGALLHVNLANRGNALAEDIRGNVTLSQGERGLFTQALEMTSFLPETAVAYPFTFARTPVEDTYKLTGWYRVGKGPRQEIEADVEFGSEEADEFEQETGREPVRDDGTSALLIGLVVLGVGALVAAIVVLRRRARGEPGGGKVDLNTAGIDELVDLPGVGRRAAERIIAHREEYGRFSTAEDLERVEGFDALRVRDLKGRVRT